MPTPQDTPVQCSNCGLTFFTPAKDISSLSVGGDEAVPEGSLPNTRPFMNQPPGVNDDFDSTVGSDATQPDHETDSWWRNPYELGQIFKPSLAPTLSAINDQDIELRCPHCNFLNSISMKENDMIPTGKGDMDEAGATPDEIGSNAHSQTVGEFWRPFTDAMGGRDEYISKNKRWASIMKIAGEFGQGHLPEINMDEMNNAIDEIQHLSETDHPLGPTYSNTDPPLAPYKPNYKIATPYDMGDMDAADFEIIQVIPNGPHTVEKTIEGESTPLILQHENPEVLENAKDKLSTAKRNKVGGFLSGLLPAAITGIGAALTPETFGLSDVAAGAADAGLAADAASSIGSSASGGLMSGLLKGALKAAPYAAETNLLSGPVHGIEQGVGGMLGFGPDPAMSNPVTNNLQTLAAVNGDENAPKSDVKQMEIPLDGEIGQKFISILPKLLDYYFSEESGAEDPEIQGFVMLLNTNYPGIMNLEPSEEDLAEIESVNPKQKKGDEEEEPLDPSNDALNAIENDNLNPRKNVESSKKPMLTSIEANLRQADAWENEDFDKRLNDINNGQSFSPQYPPIEERSYGDPAILNQVPITNPLSDPNLAHFISAVDEQLALDEMLTPDEAIYNVAQYYGLPPDELKQIYDRSIALELSTLGPGAMANPDIARYYQAPDVMPDMGQLPPAPKLGANPPSNSWTFNDESVEEPTTVFYKRVETAPEIVDKKEINDIDNDHWQWAWWRGETEPGGSQSAYLTDLDPGTTFMDDKSQRENYYDMPSEDDVNLTREIAMNRHKKRQSSSPNAGLDAPWSGDEAGLSSYPNYIPQPQPRNFPTVNDKQNPEDQSWCAKCGSKFTGFVCPFCNFTPISGWGQQGQPTPGQLAQEQQTTELIKNQQNLNAMQSQQRMSSQGPHSIEQLRMVYQYLVENGRGDEAQNLINDPDAYANELARVQHRGLIPPAPEAAPMAPQVPPPMPQPGQQPMMPPPQTVQASYKDAADSIAPICPNCGSHTTGVASNKGDCRCHACGNSWNVAPLYKDDIKSMASLKMSKHAWQTKTGEPLEEGAKYEMYLGGLSVPEIITVDKITPENIVYSVEGPIRNRNIISSKDPSLNHISFVPLGNSLPNTAPDQPDRALHTDAESTMGTPFTGWPEETGMSIQSSTPSGLPTMDAFCMECDQPFKLAYDPQKEVHNPICASCRTMTKEAGKDYSLREQRALINEKGTARNLDALDLSQTHYIDDRDLEDELLFAL
jgi:hypothetical protein